MNKTIPIKISLYILPACIPMLLFWFIPIFVTFGISFTNWDYMTELSRIRFLGVKNYISIFKDIRFYQCLLNTLAFTIGTVLPMMLIGFTLAQLIYSHKKEHPIFRILLFSPWVTPTVAISIVWIFLFDTDQGFLNQILSYLNVSKVPWLTSSKVALISVMLVTVWKSAGYAMVIFLGALHRIPKSLFEAASMDGAGTLEKIWFITLPEIRNTILFLIFTGTVSSIRAYDQIQILTQGGPSGSTRTLIYYFYQLGFEEFDTGKASATAIIILIITVSISAVQFMILSKKESSR
ncbi:permease component of ABC-type sugar transporter [Lachnospiraceae bacterium JC7]|nr:permease component of ABC-type sugar transporter [Lachnospiraceae bacterium JC7]